MLAPPPPPPPPRAFSEPPPPEPATATPRGGGVRLFQSRVVATPTVTNKQTMRPAGTPRHDGMAAAKEVIFGGQASWLARGSGTPRLTQPPRGSRTAAAARKHMRSDVDEVVFGRDMDRSSGAEADADDSVIRDADLADGIRPAGGKPAISAKTVRGKVRARRVIGREAVTRGATRVALELGACLRRGRASLTKRHEKAWDDDRCARGGVLLACCVYGSASRSATSRRASWCSVWLRGVGTAQHRPKTTRDGRFPRVARRQRL